MNPRKILSIPVIATLLATIAMLGACNEKRESQFYQSPVNLAVTSFYLKNIGDQELDTVFFSIDLKRCIIFNADSLRKGTDVSKVVANIKFSNDVSEAVIEMKGGTTREGEIDYQKSPTDSIDFTGDVFLRVKASNNEIGTTYRIKVNVHTLDPDSLYWDETAKSVLPSRLSSPKRQKTVDMGGRIVSLIEEKDGSYTLATTESVESYNWTKSVALLPFTPDISSMSATEEALWILDTSGKLYRSENGKDWHFTGEEWTSLIGSYTGTVVGLKKAGKTFVFTQYPAIDLQVTEIPADFPVSGQSNFVTLNNKWTSSPVAFFIGGVSAGGDYSDSTWAFDGKEWIKLSNGGIPAMQGASIIPYYNYRPSATSNSMIEYKVWMVVGGRKADGEFNRTVYISYDNGVNWAKGSASMQLPPCIPAMAGFDNIVADTRMEANISDAWQRVSSPRRISHSIEGNVIIWECPYIYLFGGYSADGTLYDTVWKGVLSRLTFTPVF